VRYVCVRRTMFVSHCLNPDDFSQRIAAIPSRLDMNHTRDILPGGIPQVVIKEVCPANSRGSAEWSRWFSWREPGIRIVFNVPEVDMGIGNGNNRSHPSTVDTRIPARNLTFRETLASGTCCELWGRHLIHSALLSLEFPLKFLKLFQDACRFPLRAGGAYHAYGNTEHIWLTRWEAL